MNEIKTVLGIDTSNYKTSVAIVDLNGNTVSDVRKLLSVERGERGLRQSNALFQHVENLPHLMAKAFEKADKNDICAVAVSSKPRPTEGSYMPCFNAGLSLAKSIGSVLNVPVYEFSHQEGHIEAIINNSCFSDKSDFIVYHLSGGTCEMLHVTQNAAGYSIEIIGGSKDISYGQVLDRAGVAMGLDFPAGEALDKIALNASAHSKTQLLKGIPVSDTRINLSGIDSQFRRLLERDDIDEIKDGLVCELFRRIAASLVKMTENAYKMTETSDFAFVGGVSGSEFVKKFLIDAFKKSNIKLLFGDSLLSQDNAVGTALLGVKKYGTQTR